jgi:hypothetical protein
MSRPLTVHYTTPTFTPPHRNSHPVTRKILPYMAIMCGSPFFPPVRALHPQPGINVTPIDSSLYHTHVHTPDRNSHPVTKIILPYMAIMCGSPFFPPVRALHPQPGINVTPTDSPLHHTSKPAPLHRIVNIYLSTVIFHISLVEMTKCHVIFAVSRRCTCKFVSASHPYILIPVICEPRSGLRLITLQSHFNIKFGSNPVEGVAPAS